MKLAAVVTAVDGGPSTFYRDMVPLFVAAWQRVVPGVRIVIVVAARELPEGLAPYAPLCHLVDPGHMHPAFVAQCVRLLWPGTLQLDGAEDAVLITDVDMLPARRSYYEAPLASAPPDAFVHYRPDPDGVLDELFMCYNAATPATWARVFQLTNGSVFNTLAEWWAAAQPYSGEHGGQGWGTDQKRLRAAAAAFVAGGGRFVRLDDAATQFRRLNRYEFSAVTPDLLNAVRAGVFADYHIWRPHAGQLRTINECIASFLSDDT